MVTSTTIYNNFFDQVSWRELYAYIGAQSMKYGAKSNSQNDPHGHWSWKPIYDEQKNTADITHMLPPPLKRAWDVVRERLYANDDPHVVIRSYANGYTYGTDGYFHQDSQRPDEDTIIIYMVDDWRPDWAGETVFLSIETEPLLSVLPGPNRVVVAPSSMLHAARAVSRLCPTLRRTLMFKTRKARRFQWETFSRWLADNGALKHKHQDGSLHDHLMRVYDLMCARPCPEHACAAGAFHSIYGTNAFKQALLSRSDIIGGRQTLAGVIGREAEELVYIFSMLDRPRTLKEHANDDVLTLDTMSSQVYQLRSREQKHHLCLIEAANLLDQGQLDRWPVLKATWEQKQ